jgi:hypothetical protein
MEMKKLTGLGVLTVLFLFGSAGQAQDKAKPEEQSKSVTLVKVQVVLAEYDGDKKVAILPYSFLVGSERANYTNYSNFVRVGVRVPFNGTDKDGKTQYIDIGSNIDCGVTTQDDGRYSVRLSFERSSLYAPKEGEDKSAVTAMQAGQPFVPNFRSQSLVILKDGQTTEIMAAADPLNGHVFRLSVTLNVQK